MMFKDINKQEAEKILQNPLSVLFDIRDEENYKEGHHEQAVHLSAINFEKAVNNIQPDVPILVMCYHGISSQHVAQLLIDYGFKQVYSIKGGYCEWMGIE